MRSARVIPALLAALVVTWAGPLSLARADGDPASDFLLSQSTFLSPFDGHVSSGAASGVVGMLMQAQKHGFALKVAVVVTPYDLGSVPILFGKPKTYAKFLGEEDFYYWKAELLVVMPDGYGIYRAAGVPPADLRLVDALRSPATSNGTALVLDAQRVVRSLAARHGITLALGSGGSTSSGDAWVERGEIAAVAVVVVLAGVGLRFARRRRGAA